MSNNLQFLTKIGQLLSKSSTHVSHHEVTTTLDCSPQETQTHMAAYLRKYKKKTEGIFMVTYEANNALFTQTMSQVQILSCSSHIVGVKILGLQKSASEENMMEEERPELSYRDFAYKFEPSTSTQQALAELADQCSALKINPNLASNVSSQMKRSEPHQKIAEDGNQADANAAKKVMTNNSAVDTKKTVVSSTSVGAPEKVGQKAKPKPAAQSSLMSFFGAKK